MGWIARKSDDPNYFVRNRIAMVLTLENSGSPVHLYGRRYVGGTGTQEVMYDTSSQNGPADDVEWTTFNFTRDQAHAIYTTLAKEFHGDDITNATKLLAMLEEEKRQNQALSERLGESLKVVVEALRDVSTAPVRKPRPQQ